MTDKALFEKFKLSSSRTLNSQFITSSANGDMETIKYLLKQKNNPDTNDNKDESFVTDYNDSVLGDVNYSINSGFLMASAAGNIEVMKYLINNCEVDSNTKNYGLKVAVETNKIDSVKYLLTSPELKEHANIYYDGENIFKEANLLRIVGKDSTILEYLIFDFKIEETDEIKAYLQRDSNPVVENMFKLRQLNKELEKELTNKSLTSHKVKL